MSERIDAFGEVVVPLDRDGVLRAAEGLLEQGVETLAVSFLWSHLNPVHEDAARELLDERYPDLYVSYGSQLAQRIGEYPRAATAVLNSYIGPLMRDYVTMLLRELGANGYNDRLLFAQCDGGLIDAEDVIARPVMTLESGPVGGVVASVKAGDERGQENIIAADMGGTTFDVSVISGSQLPIRDSVVVEQHDLFLRMVDVESVGAGGGSLAWIDPQSGALRVGPQSAGAVPGPVCYGRGGTVPTVTDADLVLGLLNPDNFLGGRMTLDVEAARTAIAELGERARARDARVRGGRPGGRRQPDGGHDPQHDRRPRPRPARLRPLRLRRRRRRPRRALRPRPRDQPGRRPGRRPRLGLVGLRDRARGLRPHLRVARLHARAVRPGDDRRRLRPRSTSCAREDAARSGIEWGSLVSARSADLKYALQVYDVEAEVPEGALDDSSPQRDRRQLRTQLRPAASARASATRRAAST